MISIVSVSRKGILKSSPKDVGLKLGDCVGLVCDGASVMVGKPGCLFLENISMSKYTSEYAYNDVTCRQICFSFYGLIWSLFQLVWPIPSQTSWQPWCERTKTDIVSSVCVQKRSNVNGCLIESTLIQLSAPEWIRCDRVCLERQEESHYATLGQLQVRRRSSHEPSLMNISILIYFES